MSVARIEYVKAARKAQGKCGKCGDPIPVGAAYRHFAVGFRGSKRVRCMKPTCTPRTSELESSLVADIYVAVEGAQDSIAAMDTPTDPSDVESAVQDLTSTVQEVQDAIDQVAEQYRDQDEAFGGNGTTEGAERADTLEGNDLGSWEPTTDSPDPCDDHDSPTAGCEACQEALDAWWADVVQEANDALDGIELP